MWKLSSRYNVVIHIHVRTSDTVKTVLMLAFLAFLSFDVFFPVNHILSIPGGSIALLADDKYCVCLSSKLSPKMANVRKYHNAIIIFVTLCCYYFKWWY